jgi:integrase
MGARDITDIKPDEWEAHLATLARERQWAAATFNRRRALLMSFYNWCVDKEITPHNPIKRIRKRRETEKEPRFLTATELQMFLEVCEVAPHAICFYILANTGMRVSEALGLRWCDVDLSGGGIRIGRIFCKATGCIEERTKGGNVRMIGLNAALKELLLGERQRGYATDSQSLIVAMPSGKSPGHARIRNVFEKNLKEARLTHHGIHDLSTKGRSSSKLWRSGHFL